MGSVSGFPEVAPSLSPSPSFPFTFLSLGTQCDDRVDAAARRAGPRCKQGDRKDHSDSCRPDAVVSARDQAEARTKGEGPSRRNRSRRGPADQPSTAGLEQNNAQHIGLVVPRRKGRMPNSPVRWLNCWTQCRRGDAAGEAEQSEGQQNSVGFTTHLCRKLVRCPAPSRRRRAATSGRDIGDRPADVVDEAAGLGPRTAIGTTTRSCVMVVEALHAPWWARQRPMGSPHGRPRR